MAAAFGVACGEPASQKPPVDGPDAPTTCVPTRQYFNDEVWNPFMSSTCFACHNAQGIAAGTDLVLQSPNQPGFLDANLATVANVAAFERDGLSVLLLKPSAQIDHGGGTVIEKDGPEYEALTELVRQLKNPVVCEDTGDDPFVGVNLLGNASTFRKARTQHVPQGDHRHRRPLPSPAVCPPPTNSPSSKATAPKTLTPPSTSSSKKRLSMCG